MTYPEFKRQMRLLDTDVLTQYLQSVQTRGYDSMNEKKMVFLQTLIKRRGEDFSEENPPGRDM